MSRTHLGHDVALKSDEEEADAVEQVFIAAAVIRAGRWRRIEGSFETHGCSPHPPPSAPLLGSHWTERRWPRRLFRSRRTARAAPGGLRVMAAGMARTAASTQGGSRAIRM